MPVVTVVVVVLTNACTPQRNSIDNNNHNSSGSNALCRMVATTTVYGNERCFPSLRLKCCHCQPTNKLVVLGKTCLAHKTPNALLNKTLFVTRQSHKQIAQFGYNHKTWLNFLSVLGCDCRSQFFSSSLCYKMFQNDFVLAGVCKFSSFA